MRLFCLVIVIHNLIFVYIVVVDIVAVVILVLIGVFDVIVVLDVNDVIGCYRMFQGSFNDISMVFQ